MDPKKKRRCSTAWDNFKLISNNKVRCLLCLKDIVYHNNTSSMLRHFRSLHQNSRVKNNGQTSREKSDIDEALVDMVIEDYQSFALIEEKGFKKFVRALNPNYTLPTRLTLKAIVDEKYEQYIQKAKVFMSQAVAVSLTVDVKTSMNGDSYIIVVCHFIDTNTELQSLILGVQHFSESNTAETLTKLKVKLMSKWNISDKVTSLVTGRVPNMGTCAKMLNLRHSCCASYCLNVILNKAIEQNSVLRDIRAQCRKIVDYFKSNINAEGRLIEIKEEKGRPQLKLLREVDSDWSSTYHMLKSMYELREPVEAVLNELSTDTLQLSSEYLVIMGECLKVLSPFHDATTELSEEKKDLGSKVIPLLSVLYHALEVDYLGVLETVEANELAENLKKQLKDKLFIYQSNITTSLATLLDPRFKKIGFFCPKKANEAEKMLIEECNIVIGKSSISSSPYPIPLPIKAPPPETQGSKLWSHLDATVQQSKVENSNLDIALEVKTYLSEPHIMRSEDPLDYWEKYKSMHQNLYKVAVKILCTSSTTNSCERVFSRVEELVNKKGNNIEPSTIEKLIILNKCD